MKNKTFFSFLLWLSVSLQLTAQSNRWIAEAESPDTKITYRGDTIDMVAPEGLTLWYNERMAGDVTVEYDARVVDEGKPGDRLSDLNCFWMASDPQYPDNILKRAAERKGIFLNCYALQLYYMGYGGNENTTTRFRRYDGNEAGVTQADKRPAVLKEYTDAKHLLKPNHWYHIKLVNKKGRVRYFIDGVCLVDYTDAKPLTQGWFGFRTTLSHTQLTHFRYQATEPSFGAKRVALQWIGKGTNAVNMPNSWGVPFAKGTVQPGTAFCVESSKGVTSVDSWPLAYWADGSVKWLGLAGVVPQGATRLSLVQQQGKSHAASTKQLTVTRAGKAIKINTGRLQTTLSAGSDALFTQMVLDGQPVAGKASLVCQVQQTSQTAEGEQLTRSNYRSAIDSVQVEKEMPGYAVVKVTGKHRRDGRAWLPFVVRFYFYAGSEQVKMVHSVVYDGDMNKDFIQALGVEFEVPMREAFYNRHVAFSTGAGGVWSEPVQPLVGRRVLGAKGRQPAAANYQQMQMNGERVPAYETFDKVGRNLIDNWASWNNYRLSQLNANGFAIRKQANDNNPWIGTQNGTRANGFAFVGDVSGGLGVGLTDFWQSYPSTLEVKDAKSNTARLQVWLWSPESEPMDLRHYDNVAHDLNASYEDVQEGLSTPYGIARTHTLQLFPLAAYPGKAAVAQLAATVEEQPQLICSPEYLHAQRAFGVWSLPGRQAGKAQLVEQRLNDFITYYQHAIEEHGWYGFWNYGDVMHAYDPVRHEWRYDVGGFAWDNTELASNMWLWYNFLRTGRADIWKMAVAMTRHTGEVDVYHLGENQGLGSRHNVSHWGCGAKEARISQAAWNRFFYYLTTDERCGDLMEEVRDADQKLYTLDPMRLAQPRSLYPCSTPARLRIGPDWLAYAGNWMTHWERTRDERYLKKIVNGMKSIAALPSGIFTGPTALGYDPATGIITSEADPKLQATNHLLTIMGGFEMMNEMMAAIQLPEWQKTWLDFTANYKQKAMEIKHNNFRISRLGGYAASHLKDKAKAAEAWGDLFRDGDVTKPLEVEVLNGSEVPRAQHESKRVSTNDVSTWSLDAIYLLEVCPEALE